MRTEKGMWGGRRAGGRSRRGWFLVGISGALLLGAAVALAAAGDLDSTFAGGAGIAQADDGTFTLATHVVVLSDGRVIEGGYRQSGTWQDWMVRGWTAEGIVDATFGASGAVHLFGGTANRMGGLRVDASDRLVACGRSTVTTTVVSGRKSQTTSSLMATVVRLSPSGVLDPTFGSGGCVYLTVPSAFGTTGADAQALAVLPGGRILVAGTTDRVVKSKSYTYYYPYVFLVLLESDGTLVGTFGSGGYVLDTRDDLTASGGMTIDATGGYAYVAGGKGWDPVAFQPLTKWAVSRYVLNTGAVDASFGTGGTVVSPQPSDVVRSVALDGSRRLVAAGNRQLSSSSWAVRAVRYDGSTGAVDASFGTNGETVVTASPTVGTAGTSVVDAAGNLLLPVTIGSTSSQATVLRLDSGGAVDTTFGTGGFAQPVTLTSVVNSAAVALASDGGILLSGRAFQANPSPPNSSWVFLARYLAN